MYLVEEIRQIFDRRRNR